jgi:signal transduction histidine kinase/phage shock protein PspC (stress-responsive transcriptional regulator)
VCHHRPGGPPRNEEQTAIKQATVPARDLRAARAGWFGLTRSRSDRMLAGVAGGVGERLSVDPVFVRVAFVALGMAGGAGIVLYMLIWAVSAEPGSPQTPVHRPPPSLRRATALGLQVLGILLLLRAAGWWLGDVIVWPTVLAALGSALIYARGDRSGWLAKLSSVGQLEDVFSARVSPARLAIGALLVTAGLGSFLAANSNVAALWSVIVAVAVTTTGLVLVLGPGLWRIGRQLGDERRARIRSQERAEMAAHLHDSVLHTLALIQRTADPAEAASLARGQERELRAWLAGRGDGDGSRLSAAVDALASRVERHHHVPVETVVVGDAKLDERTGALLDAAAEAANNAARHSGAAVVSLYVEVEPDEITAYVRDEGAGFDPEQVPADRRGIAESIHGRMRRHGGTATITSEPGEGTEVALRLARKA